MRRAAGTNLFRFYRGFSTSKAHQTHVKAAEVKSAIGLGGRELPHPDFLSYPKSCSVLGVPFSWGQPLAGTDIGPSLMRERGLLKSLNSLEWRVREEGDLDLVLPGRDDPQGVIKHCWAVGQTNQRLYERAKACAEAGDFVLTLGGDHSIAVGSVAAILSVRPETGIIWVDAHADINTAEISPSANAHGMPLAFLMHLMDPAKHCGFEWLTDSAPRLSADQIVYVGLRDVDHGERKILHEQGILSFTMSDVDRYGIGVVMEKALEHLEGRPLHMSYDIDAVDPSVAPATGTVVRGGLTYREALFVAEIVAETGALGSLDMVEVNPSLAPGVGTDLTVELANLLTCSAMGSRIL